MVRLILFILLSVTPVFLISKKPETLTLRFAGDTMLGTDYPSKQYLPPNQGKNLFDGVKTKLGKADLFLINLEGVIADRTTKNAKGSGKNLYSFRMHPLLSLRLKAVGVHVANLANNHGLDFGVAGFKQSQHHLKQQGILSAGVKNRPVYIERKGLKVGILGFSTSYYYNTVFDLKAATDLIQATKMKCDFLIITFHGGGEGEKYDRVTKTMEVYLKQRRGNIHAFSHNAIHAGADMVIGHGPHVLRAMELYQGKLIAYSLGNFIGYGRFSTSGKKGYSVVLEVSIDQAGQLLHGSVTPIRMNQFCIPYLDPNGLAINQLNRLAELDFPKTGIKVHSSGQLIFPK